MADRFTLKYAPYDGLMAKVKVRDQTSGLCFESDIYPEEVITNSAAGIGSETTMTFSPVRVPDIKNWNAKWIDWNAKPREGKKITIKKIIFSGPCTIVLWDDGTKTIARVSEGDEFDPEKGVSVCFMKKIIGHTETNKLLRRAHDQYWDEQDKKENVINQIKECIKDAKKSFYLFRAEHTEESLKGE